MWNSHRRHSTFRRQDEHQNLIKEVNARVLPPGWLGCSANSLSNTWAESTINYNNAPPLGSVIGSAGAFSAGVWINLDVTAYITGNGLYNLGLTTPSNTAISFASRQAGANAPQLIVETAP